MRSTALGRLALLVLLPMGLLAQTADLSGIIFDPSGLAVPNAKIRATSRARGVTRDVSSNQEGLYRISALPPGSYDLTVEATGFRSIRQTGIVLEVDQRATLDFALTTRQYQRHLTVKGNAPLVNASDASVSTVIGNRFVENMPLNGRSFRC